MTRKHWAGLAWVLLIPLAADPAGAEPPVGTAFTYQGRLTSSGTAANGTYDFEFRLYDDPLAGTLVAGPITVPSVPVTSGLFTATLDFGSTPFAGKVRWLAIAVKASGTADPFTPLDRRQVLSPAPYAVFSSFTDPANLTNLDASHLTTGVLPSAQLSGSYTSALSLTSPSNVFVGDGSGLTNLSPQALFRRTVVVRPVGSAAANGAALLAALAGIASPSAANPWLLKIEPGVYNVGAPGSLVMRPFVDIEGSGETVTKITGPGDGSNAVGTVQAVNNSELRFLTVENTGGNPYARALYVGAGSPRIRNVTVLASGGTTETQGFFADGLSTAVVTDLTVAVTASAGSTYGVLNVNASSTMTNVQSTATGGAFAQAFWNCCAPLPSSVAPTLRNVVGIASGGTAESRGMTNSDMSPVLENVVAIAVGPSPTNRGILTFGVSAPYMRFVTCRGIGATVGNYGCYNDPGAHPTMMDVYAEASGGSSAEAMHNEATAVGLSLTRARLVASGGSSINRGYYANAASPPLTEVEAVAIAGGGSESTGIYLNASSSILTHVTASGSSSAAVGNAVGIHILGAGAAPTLDQVVALGIGGNQATGVWSGDSTQPTLSQVTSSGSNAANISAGLFNQSGSTLTAVGTTATASAPAGNTAYAIWNQGSSLVTLSGVRAGAAGGGTNYGVLNNASPGTVKIDRSTISGTTGSIQNAVASTVNVGGSQLVGPINSIGTYTCVFSYNGAFAALNATCN